MADETQPPADDAGGQDVPHLVVEFDGDRGLFPAHPGSNAMLALEYADDLAADGYVQLKAIVVLATDQVLPEHRERFRDFLTVYGRHEDFMQTVYDALSACWKGETNLPLALSSNSSATFESPGTES